MIADLNGVRILVTRPATQAVHLCELIEEHGGKVLAFPTLEICGVPIEPGQWEAVASADWFIFTSSNAVNFAIKAFDGKMTCFDKSRIAAIGQGTARALQNAGWRIDCIPEKIFSSEGLLLEPQFKEVAGKTCVIIKGTGGREILRESLGQRGAEVFCLEVYRRIKPELDSIEVDHYLATKQLGALTITSMEALENLLAMLGKASHAQLKELPLVVVSDRIRLRAESLGFKRIAVSEQPSDVAILKTLTMLLSGEYSGRCN